HECRSLPAQSLEASWRKCREWVDRCKKVIGADIANWLDREQAVAIREEVGMPPNPCYPIYIFSVGENPVERPVYIGRTSGAQGRFAGGHDACTKLLHPKFNGLRKRVYLGCVTLNSAVDEEYLPHLPLEW